MNLTLKGKLTKILNMESGVARSGNAWKKQDFVIETDDQYPKMVCFTLFNDKVSMLSGMATGDLLEVSFDVESREFNSKYYHNLNAWKITKVTSGGAANDMVPPPYTVSDIPPEPLDNESDGLPF
jgi:hypothetical protein